MTGVESALLADATRWPSRVAHPLRGALHSTLIAAGVAMSGCVRPPVPDAARVTAEIRERTKAADATLAATAEAWLTDGLSEDEAVGLALARSADFKAALADLGIAEATVAEAAQLRNPALTLLLPWGPKQFEATARWPLDALYLRGRRVKAARFDAEAVARRLVADGLELVFRTRQAWADAALALERGPIVEDGVRARERIGAVAEERVRLGEVSAFEISVVRAERARAAEDRIRQGAQQEIAFRHLGALVGRPDGSVTLQETDTPAPACLDVAALLQEARAARPEIRGAELTVEGAAGRLGLSRLEAIGLVAIADANAEGSQGFEAGPGFEVQLPLFHSGGAARQRAQAELARGRARLLALHQQVELEVRERAPSRPKVCWPPGRPWWPRARRTCGSHARVWRSARIRCWWLSSRSDCLRTPACAAPTRAPSCARAGLA